MSATTQATYLVPCQRSIKAFSKLLRLGGMQFLRPLPSVARGKLPVFGIPVGEYMHHHQFCRLRRRWECSMHTILVCNVVLAKEERQSHHARLVPDEALALALLHAGRLEVDAVEATDDAIVHERHAGSHIGELVCRAGLEERRWKEGEGTGDSPVVLRFRFVGHIVVPFSRFGFVGRVDVEAQLNT
ncbi:uncharacterized protein BDZ99DRAFT_219869 [Mytilinidion resinicola]|uniref:Uncharacterized protein n=1 Tax=Mytilinidion resinicola TaxID=574789 RepID=A0A6A6XZB4_9PEZI|nr:uncharacterized protein BDZ99DRAFT_219869 [Mytilinidion resinicola]KAF2801603.1 hypothetical protein BDZ99DRAFT_219869 [Mytilinidion resinicola]